MSETLTISALSFPVFYIGKVKPVTENGITFFAVKEDYYDGTVIDYEKVIDDKNVPGTSLAARRLQMIQAKRTLYKLKHAIYFLGDLVKYSRSECWFIDSAGTIFSYKKTTPAKLVCMKIDKVIPIASGVIVEIDKLALRFKALIGPSPEEKWAGLLYFKNSYILYGFFKEPFDTTTRYV